MAAAAVSATSQITMFGRNSSQVCAAADVRRLLLAWALLLAHLQSQPAGARARAWLTESLAEVEG